jgi:hypothetical protein
MTLKNVRISGYSRLLSKGGGSVGAEQSLPILMEIAKVWGIPYALFIGMLLYVLYKNDKREVAYQAIIERYGENIAHKVDAVQDSVDNVQRDIADIRQHMYSKL